MWKRKPLEKVTTAADKANASLQRNEEEIQTLLQDKADMDRELKIIREKLSSALSDCNAKAQIAQEAISGWEKMETQAMAMKQQLDKALQEKDSSEERLVHLDAALKESLRQLRVVREDQGKRVHDAVVKTSRDYEGRIRTLEGKLAEAGARLTRFDSENTQLSKALLTKERVIEELKELQTRMETELSALLNRLESTEKDNTSLKYEVCVLEKQLDIRNEEREFSQRTADVSHKQYIESAKKIAKLESECQRLRLLVRKRLPGPAALAKMKSEVEILGRDPADVRRKPNQSPYRSAIFSVDMVPDTPSRKVDFLTHQLSQLDEENRNLKETLNKMGSELQFSRAARVPSERQHEELQNGHMVTELRSTMLNGSLQELSLTSMSDMGSDDKASCADTWASSLITELEHLKNGKPMGTPSRRSFGSSDINLMDDFIEIEKLAVGLTDNPKGSTDSHLKRDLGDRDVSATKRNSGRFQSNASVSLHKIIKLVEGINIPSLDGRNPDGIGYSNSDTPSGYMVRVLQWKTNELSTILEQFVESCRELSLGKVHFEKFTEQLTCTLEWILNHCFSIQDVSSMKDEIKNNFDWDDTRSESEIESGTMNQISNSCQFHSEREGLPALPLVSGGDNHSVLVDELQSTSKEDDIKLEEEFSGAELVKKDMEIRQLSEVSKSESLMIQVQELEKTVRSLQEEVVVLNQSNISAENQIEKQKMANEELEKQLTAAKCELDEACEKFLSLEEELEDKTSSLEKLKVTCDDLELQLRAKPEFLEDKVDNREVLLQKDKDIEAASETLAECQETITNLGKQLKALASPKDRAIFDKLAANPIDSPNVSTESGSPIKTFSRRSSLLEKLLAEDRAEMGDHMSQTDKTSDMHEDEAPDSPTTPVVTNKMPRSEEKPSIIGSNAIVPVKKKDGMWKKIWRRNSTSKKLLA